MKLLAVPENGKHPSYLDYQGKHKGLLGWILSTDHKRIGILYMVAILSFFMVGVTFGFLMRLELIAPGRTIMDAQTYNSFFTLHGVIMIFLFVIPGIPAVFGNFFLPILIGAKDVSFPRLNLLSWYLYVIGGCLAFYLYFYLADLLILAGRFISHTVLEQELMLYLALICSICSWIFFYLTGLNFVTTVHRSQSTWNDLV